MAAAVTVSANLVSIMFPGLERALCLSNGVDLHGDEITGVQLMPRREARALLGLRVGGGYWPNRMTTGWFTTRGSKGTYQLWDVFGDDEVLVIDTTRPKPSRVVLQHPDRVRLLDKIRAVASGR
jgi:hypothetical protein